MFFPLFAFLSYLLFMCTASAQIHAPTCSVKNGDYDWVGSLSANPRHVSITACLSHRAGVFIHRRTILSNKTPVRSQHTCREYAAMAVSCTFQLAHRVRSYGGVTAFTLPALGTSNVYSVADNGNQCMCNTVVYNLFSACCGCQGGSWNPCVDLLLFPPGFPANQPLIRVSYSAWSSNCITKATAGT